jgi:hypothetical protein
MDIPFKKGGPKKYRLIYILESFKNLSIILLISSSLNYLRFHEFFRLSKLYSSRLLEAYTPYRAIILFRLSYFNRTIQITSKEIRLELTKRLFTGYSFIKKPFRADHKIYLF